MVNYLKKWFLFQGFEKSVNNTETCLKGLVEKIIPNNIKTVLMFWYVFSNTIKKQFRVFYISSFFSIGTKDLLCKSQT